jgi:nucleotide-binding universal stress UspA family protein
LAIVSPVIEEAPGPAVIAADAARLTGLGRRFTDLGIDVLVQQLDAASVPALVHECEKWEADLIIVGSHHHSLLYRWLIGSMTSDVLKLARCPVLVVPADVETAGGN